MYLTKPAIPLDSPRKSCTQNILLASNQLVKTIQLATLACKKTNGARTVSLSTTLLFLITQLISIWYQDCQRSILPYDGVIIALGSFSNILYISGQINVDLPSCSFFHAIRQTVDEIYWQTQLSGLRDLDTKNQGSPVNFDVLRFSFSTVPFHQNCLALFYRAELHRLTFLIKACLLFL